MGGGKEQWHTGVLKSSVDPNEVILNRSGYGNLVWILHFGKIG